MILFFKEISALYLKGLGQFLKAFHVIKIKYFIIFFYEKINITLKTKTNINIRHNLEFSKAETKTEIKINV